jgi:hypothetical protein
MEERKDEPVEGHKRLAFEIISRALDDICPAEEPGEQVRTPEEREEFMKEQLENINLRVQRYQIYESELDTEWEQIEREAEIKFGKHVSERDSTFDRIRGTHNGQRIAVGVARYESQKSSRIRSVTARTEADKMSYLKRVDKERAKGNPTNQTEIDSKISELDRNLQNKIQAITERYDGYIRNLQRTNNKETVERRLENSREVWNRRAEELWEQLKVREANHNSKRQEFDQIRLAIDWFIADVEKVSFWCQVAGIPLIQCYEGVKRRLDLIHRQSDEFDAVLKRVKSGEFMDKPVGFRRVK